MILMTLSDAEKRNDMLRREVGLMVESLLKHIW